MKISGKILGIIVALFLLFTVVACEETEPLPPLVTGNCTNPTTTSLTAHATVNSLEAGNLSKRGFVFAEGTEGDPELEVIPLVNPSFEDGNAVAANWTYRNSDDASRVSDPVKTGSYALKYEYPKDTPYGFARTALFDRTEWGGRDITIGAWVKTDIGNCVRIQCYEWGGAWRVFAASSYHPGDGEWHFLLGVGTVPTDLTADFAIMVTLVSTRSEDITFYVDGFSVAEGLAVFEDGQFDTGEYSLVITGLKPDTSYRVRAFVENEAGISYGNTVTCKTLS